MDESRAQNLILRLRRELHPDATPPSTYLIAIVAESAREWSDYLVKHWNDELSRQTALGEMQFCFDTIRYIRQRMDRINSPLLSAVNH